MLSKKQLDFGKSHYRGNSYLDVCNCLFALEFGMLHVGSQWTKTSRLN